MSRVLFSVTILLITGVLLQVYNYASTLNEGGQFKAMEIQLVKEKLAQAELSRDILAYNLNQFQQEVALVLPNQMKKLKPTIEAPQLRSLASVLNKKDSEPIKSKLAENSFINGQRYFRAGRYEEAIKKLSLFVDNYSYSYNAVNAYSMLAEAYYQTGALKKSVKTIELMVDLYPGHELTGFALIRMGTILKQQDLPDQAGQTYMTVMEAFKSNPALREQARRLLVQL